MQKERTNKSCYFFSFFNNNNNNNKAQCAVREWLSWQQLPQRLSPPPPPPPPWLPITTSAALWCFVCAVAVPFDHHALLILVVPAPDCSQSFVLLHQSGSVNVDKTHHLVAIMNPSSELFLSQPLSSSQHSRLPSCTMAQRKTNCLRACGCKGTHASLTPMSCGGRSWCGMVATTGV